MGLTPALWRSRRVLVTGHTGFKGGWLSHWLLKLGADVHGLALPPTSSSCVFAETGLKTQMHNWIVDLTNREATASALQKIKPEVVFHLAAQAIVSEGYRNPARTFETNVMGTLNLLDALPTETPLRSVVVATSDKVYRESKPSHAFEENDALGGDDPYSGSKASTEHVVEVYRKTIFSPKEIPITAVRAGNVIGGGDDGINRLLPDVNRNILNNTKLLVRMPEARRPWQHVLNVLEGYIRVAEMHISAPENSMDAINFGPPPSESITVRKLLELLEERCPGFQWVSSTTSNTIGMERPVLLLNCSLAENQLGWRPRIGLKDGLDLTVEWWQSARRDEDMTNIVSKQISHVESNF